MMQTNDGTTWRRLCLDNAMVTVIGGRRGRAVPRAAEREDLHRRARARERIQGGNLGSFASELRLERRSQLLR
jgi:hypothetical protein